MKKPEPYEYKFVFFDEAFDFIKEKYESEYPSLFFRRDPDVDYDDEFGDDEFGDDPIEELNQSLIEDAGGNNDTGYLVASDLGYYKSDSGKTETLMDLFLLEFPECGLELSWG